MSIKDNVKAKVESNKTLNRFFGGKKLVLAVGIAAAVLVALGAAIFLNVKIRENMKCCFREYLWMRIRKCIPC